MKTKLSLNELKVESFITSLHNSKIETIKGGTLGKVIEIVSIWATGNGANYLMSIDGADGCEGRDADISKVKDGIDTLAGYSSSATKSSAGVADYGMAISEYAQAGQLCI
jgi:hypothetical protein